MNTDTRTALESAHRAVMAEIAHLTGVKANLESALAATPTPQSHWPATGSGVAPAGLLEDAILDVLRKSKAPQSKKGIITLLKESGYPYSLAPNHVTKFLQRLTRAKKLSMQGNRRNATYAAMG